MHEEKEQHNLWLVGQIHIFGIFQKIFYIGKRKQHEKSTHTFEHSGDLARVPLGQICIEGKCLIKRCKECATTFKENDNTPHKKTQQVPKIK